MVDGCGDGLLKPDIPFVSFVSQFGSASSADHGRRPVVRTQPTACLPVVVTAAVPVSSATWPVAKISSGQMATLSKVVP
jgi:hypothetical protein